MQQELKRTFQITGVCFVHIVKTTVNGRTRTMCQLCIFMDKRNKTSLIVVSKCVLRKGSCGFQQKVNEKKRRLSGKKYSHLDLQTAFGMSS